MGIIFCSAGRGTAPQHRPASLDDSHAHNQQQRNRGGGRRFAADWFRGGNFVSSAEGAALSSFRDRSTDGHGANGSHRSGKLRGVRGDRAMGRRISREACQFQLGPLSVRTEKITPPVWEKTTTSLRHGREKPKV